MLSTGALGRLAVVLYLGVMIALADVRPLWLDEILQLMDTRQPSAGVLIERLPAHHTGSAPLGYLVQQASLRVTGYSVRRARLPSALFGAGALLATMMLAAELGLNAWAAGAILAVLPLTLRYATEARPYSMALFFSVVATLVYVRLARNPRWTTAAVYALALAGAAYSQPYAASVGVAHLLWSLAGRDRRAGWYGGWAAAVALAIFLPWPVHAWSAWKMGTGPEAAHFAASWRTPLMLVREFSGAGYWGSGLLLVLGGMAVRGGWQNPRKRLLGLLVVAPVVCAVAGDAAFGYFLAARQFLWALPAAALLAAESGWIPRLLLVAVCLWHSAGYLRDGVEDWQAAASAIQAETAQGACLRTVPAEQRALYEFFRSELARAACDGPRVVLALSPYASGAQRRAALGSEGCVVERLTRVGGTDIVLLRCRDRMGKDYATQADYRIGGVRDAPERRSGHQGRDPDVD